MKNIYQTTEELLQSNYVELLTLANCIQEKVVNDSEYKVNDNETAELTFSRYFELLLKMDFLHDDELPNILPYIEEQKKNFFATQSDITIEKFNEIKETNIAFITLFWEDLKMYKTFDIVIDIGQKIVVPQHQAILGDIMNESTVLSLAKSGFEEEDIILFSISKEDKSLITITSLYIPETGKKEMMKHYNDNDMVKNKTENYEDYMLGLLRENIKKMKAEKETAK